MEQLRCSFCNKSSDQVEKMIVSPNEATYKHRAYICSLCVDECCDIMKWGRPFVMAAMLKVVEQQKITTRQILAETEKRDPEILDKPFSHFFAALNIYARGKAVQSLRKTLSECNDKIQSEGRKVADQESLAIAGRKALQELKDKQQEISDQLATLME